MAIKSGMLAAEPIFEAPRAGDTSAKTLSAFPQKVDQSWIKKDLWAVRNFHQAYQHGLWAGLFHTAIQFVTGGRGLIDPMRVRPGHEAYRRLDGAAGARTRFKGDGVLTFDRLTDVYHSGTRHEEDQPCHLVVADTDICTERCAREYGNPCQYFCPAAGLRMVRGKGKLRPKINASKCGPLQNRDNAHTLPNLQRGVPE